ncbi:MAG: LPS export ABC transporter periplasmic protein LptC [Bacteroidales bacterium]|jgi:LPS export ABC transporter protein LptC|nr:LPS export ABC transporter periplasmic protein LptC [Bacteroidales bacterium]MDD3843643.1 LPS export ABC transporter periplasmic protein LptC [Bacteroidales bacterium]
MFGIPFKGETFNIVAVTLVIATLLFSCKEDIPRSNLSQVEELPTQIVEGMTVFQFSRGITDYIVNAPLMERYTQAETPYDVFPKGITMRGYTAEGLLETMIVADYAKNLVKEKEEIWEAYGNVVINNYLKGEKMETDTLYWNRLTQRIFTHTLVKLTTPDMFMQGYGMESDDMARNAVIEKPFDSYAIVSRDSTEISYIDTANFIGPRLRNF